MKRFSKTPESILLIVGCLLCFMNSCEKEEAKKDPILSWTNPADIFYGTALSDTQLNASANVPGTFVYTPSKGTILIVGANQDLKVDFTPANKKAYNVSSMTVRINVIEKINPAIAWENPDDIIVGTLLSDKQLNATADVPGTFVYTPAIGTSLDVGYNQALLVEFIPDNGTVYNTISKTVYINVTVPFGSMKDIDGNQYKTIIIGTQTWMAENLKVSKYNDGSIIPIVADTFEWAGLKTGATCSYENDGKNISVYGKLYNWYAVNTDKLCPTGWHVPSIEEWNQLNDYLGGENIAGGKLKETGTNHWISPNSSASNFFGFSALPGGACLSDGKFYNTMGYFGNFWFSTDSSSEDAKGCTLYYNRASSEIGNSDKRGGYSIRCVKD